MNNQSINSNPSKQLHIPALIHQIACEEANTNSNVFIDATKKGSENKPHKTPSWQDTHKAYIAYCVQCQAMGNEPLLQSEWYREWQERHVLSVDSFDSVKPVHPHIAAIRKWQRENPTIDVTSDVVWVVEYDESTKTTSVQAADSVKQASKHFVYNRTYWVKHKKKEWNRDRQCYEEKGDDVWHEYLKYPRIFARYAAVPKTKDLGSTHALKVKQLWDANMTNIKDSGVVVSAYKSCVDYVVEQGLNPPVLDKRSFACLEDEGFPKGFHSNIKRMSRGKWWDSGLAKKRHREWELKRIKAGKVKQYVSDVALSNFMLRTQSSEDYMNNLLVVSEDGELLEMSDVLESSMSNVVNRRNEANVRIYGLTKYADDHGHKVAFYTITAPSKYHSNSRKYNGASPRDTQEYLARVWNNAMAKLIREEIGMYGQRFTEPHGDATPHWHCVCFYKTQEDKDKATAIIKKWFLAEDIAELKIKKYHYVASIKNLTKQATQLANKIERLSDRKRLFKRDWLNLSISSSQLIKAINAQIGRTNEDDLIARYKSLRLDLGFMLVELELIKRNDKHFADLQVKADTFIKVFTTLHDDMVKRFDKFSKVYKKNDQGKKEFKCKSTVRFDVENIKSGAAVVAYVMKYVAKNITGGIGEDKEVGGDTKDTSARVRAWASLWGIP